MDLSSSTVVYIAIFFVLLPGLVGGAVARMKNDFFSRGLVISIFSSWFGPLFMYFTRPSLAREGDAEDEESWPPSGPLACGALILVCVLIWLGAKFIS